MGLQPAAGLLLYGVPGPSPAPLSPPRGTCTMCLFNSLDFSPLRSLLLFGAIVLFI